MSLRALAKKAGLSHATIDDIEKGHHIPAADTVECLAEVLDVSPCWLAYSIGKRQIRKSP